MKLKNKHKILRFLHNNINERYIISQLPNFASSFKGISRKEVLDWLEIMNAEKLIYLAIADYPESDNIHYIQLLPSGLNYFVNLSLRKKDIRRTWWQMLGAGFLGFALSLVAQFIFWKSGILP